MEPGEPCTREQTRSPFAESCGVLLGSLPPVALRGIARPTPVQRQCRMHPEEGPLHSVVPGRTRGPRNPHALDTLQLMHNAALLGEGLADARAFGWQLPDSPTHDWNALVSAVHDHIAGLNFGYGVALREKVGARWLLVLYELSLPQRRPFLPREPCTRTRSASSRTRTRSSASTRRGSAPTVDARTPWPTAVAGPAGACWSAALTAVVVKGPTWTASAVAIQAPRARLAPLPNARCPPP